MRKWLIKQFEKFELNAESLKTQAELNAKVLKPGETESIIFPFETDQNGIWKIKSWHFESGSSIEVGEIICIVKNDQLEVEFESFLKGKLNYFKKEGQKIEKGMVIAEVTGA